MKNLIILIITSVCFFSCEKTVLLDLNQTTPRVIIEGLVTDQQSRNYVKVSRSNGFYDSGVSPRVADANVTVKDDSGNEYIFIHNPRNHSDSAGYYLPATPFAGVIGRTYSLTVIIGEASYEGSDMLRPVTHIDSLGFQINEDEVDDPNEEGKTYEVLLYAREPQESTDYYLFKFYRNDSLKTYDDTDIYFADDEVLGEEIGGVASPVYFAPGDTARVEMYSLSRNGFVFYSDLQSLLQNDGGLFSQPPSNSRTNLSNGALGYFQTSALSTMEITIKE